MSSSRRNNNHPAHTSNNDDEEEDEDNSGSYLDSDDDELPELVANIGEDETDDETGDDERTIRVTALPATLIPLRTWNDGEEVCGSGNHTIGAVQQQPDRRGWTLGNREMNDQYLRYDTGNNPFLARTIGHQPMYPCPVYELWRYLNENPELNHRFIHPRERNENEEKDDDEKEDSEEES